MGGQPKVIPFGGRPLVQHIVETLEKVVAGCLIVPNTPERFAFLGRPMVADVCPDGGALGRSYSHLTRAATPPARCVACDMPFRSPALTGGGLPTLHALSGRARSPVMKRRLDAGPLKVSDVLGEVRVTRIPEARVASFGDPARLSLNLNMPEEVACARIRSGGQDG